MNCPNCTHLMTQYNNTGDYVCHMCGEHAQYQGEPFQLSDETLAWIAAGRPNDPRLKLILARRAAEAPEPKPTPEERAREIIADTLDGFMSEPYTYFAATEAIMNALRTDGLKFTESKKGA